MGAVMALRGGAVVEGLAPFDLSTLTASVVSLPTRMPLGATKLAMGLLLSYIGAKSWMVPLMNKEFTKVQYTTLLVVEHRPLEVHIHPHLPRLRVVSSTSGGLDCGDTNPSSPLPSIAPSPSYCPISLLLPHLPSIAPSPLYCPLSSPTASQNDFLLGVSNSFSGGVFFMLAFGHLLPEALEGFSAIGRSHEAALLCVLAGYFAMFIFDKVLFDPHVGAGVAAEGVTEAAATSTAAVAGGKGNKKDAKDAKDAKAARVWDRSSMTLVGAMSIHSAFETVALGLSRDKKSASLMFASIAIHQPAESVALLVALLKSGMTKGQIAHLLLAYSSVGIVATLASTFLARFATPTVDAFVMALTAGTFLYVSATEVSDCL